MLNLPFLKNFIAYLKKNNYSEETIYNYKRDLETFKIFLNKISVKFQEVSSQIITNYTNYLTSMERKQQKIKKVLKH